MQPPRWDDPIGSATTEATPATRRGLPVRPTLYGFEDGEPTIRVQVGLRTLDAGLKETAAELFGLVTVLDLRQVLVFSHVRTSDQRVEDDDLRAALATYGLIVEVGERAGGSVTTAGYLVDREVVAGEVCWQAPVTLDGGLWAPPLGKARDPTFEFPPRLTVGGWGYALSRRGAVVEVAPGWRRRYGFDRVPPRLVRPEDRRRARHLARVAAQRGKAST